MPPALPGSVWGFLATVHVDAPKNDASRSRRCASAAGVQVNQTVLRCHAGDSRRSERHANLFWLVMALACMQAERPALDRPTRRTARARPSRRCRDGPETKPSSEHSACTCQEGSSRMISRSAGKPTCHACMHACMRHHQLLILHAHHYQPALLAQAVHHTSRSPARSQSNRNLLLAAGGAYDAQSAVHNLAMLAKQVRRHQQARQTFTLCYVAGVGRTPTSQGAARR